VRKIMLLASVLIFAVLMAGSISAVDTSTIYVSTTGDDGNDGLTPETAVNSINVGIDKVSENGTVKLAAGIYNKTGTISRDVGITILKNVTIAGASKETTIIDGLGASQIFEIPYDPGATVFIKDLTLQNGKLSNSGGAISSDGTLTVQNVIFKNNEAVDDGGGALFTHTTLNVINCIFLNNKANAGAAIFNKGGSITVTGSTFIGNQALTDLEKYSGGVIHNYAYSSYKIVGNTFLNNMASAVHIAFWQPGFDSLQASNGPMALININRIVGNTPYGIYLEPTEMEPAKVSAAISNAIYRVDATNNWWGSNSNPKLNPENIGGDIENVLADPWLVLTISANPSSIPYGSTATVIARITQNSNGQDTSSIGTIPDGTPITFTTNIGNVGSKTVTKYTINGIAVAILRADDGIGTANVNAILDGFRTPLPAQVAIVQAESVNAAGTVGMQETGLPIAGLVLAILMVFGGLVSTKK